jgi:hypothetical protein
MCKVPISYNLHMFIELPRLLLLCDCWWCQNMGVYALYNVYDVSLRSSRNQWKKYLTSMQIIQFIIDIVIVYFGSKFINL